MLLMALVSKRAQADSDPWNNAGASDAHASLEPMILRAVRNDDDVTAMPANGLDTLAMLNQSLAAPSLRADIWQFSAGRGAARPRL